MSTSLTEQFHRDGFVILPDRIPDSTIDGIIDGLNSAAHNRETTLLRKGGEYSHPGPFGVQGRRKRVIDYYVPCLAAREAALAEPITSFLTELYREPPLAFQSLLFQFGSQQNLHQDTAYVVTDKPSALTASWIALEDIQAGSGELIYYKGSHLDIDVRFATGKKVWNRIDDKKEDNINYAENLEQACEQAGLKKLSFLPKKGDVLIWHAGLIHGGGTIHNKELSRKSLVTHYCPVSSTPHYFNIQPDTSFKREFAGGYYSSRHYDVRPESNNPFPIYTGNKNIAELQGLKYE